ncbi:uncharacterized protein CIMG_02054 [Coccidioides immitis RS]|uniref:Uncharacterized protein n=4 Tax=Coccidioides immitis TaxID=5501 RepID=J3KKJ3_COCIM|nr:uncharacterized protein CIMG_02054 [Coccidioides immitis RS]EAS36700.3 hypothetical protein CIMG_02054 [Coccidioides immitis RS]KMU79830.1 hypothetical protein CISG_08110 [Coccidioides immitis RMSCC 3703]KMU88240.1 hypothetical protein CIHG_05411 [Coccidioides immitis H538.4]
MAYPPSIPAPSTFISFLRCLQYHSKPITSFRSTLSRRIINPRGHRISEDCYTVTLPNTTAIFIASADSAGPLSQKVGAESKPIAQFSDEELLARFTRGFFGGNIFAPERFILGIGGVKMFQAQFDGYQQRFEHGHSVGGIDVLKPSDIPKDKLLPINSKIYGGFLVIDSHILPTSSTPSQGSTNELETLYSYIDIGFGLGDFGGAHRFSIHRQCPHEPQKQANWLSSEKDREVITFSLSHFTCNPNRAEDTLATVRYLNWFHQWYARVLFADALKGVMGYY